MIVTQDRAKTFVLGFAAGILFLVMFVSPLVFAEQGGSNIVAVDACQEVANGVTVNRSGSTHTLTNGCRDAGHGERQYTLTCVSDTKYRVSWVPCATASAEPVVEEATVEVQEEAEHQPASDTQPVETESSPESSSDPTPSQETQVIVDSSVPSPQPVQQQPTQQTPPSQPAQTPAQPQEDGCGDHGYFHTTDALGDHCHCDTGYIQHPNELMCVSAAEYVSLTSNASSDTSQPQPQQPTQQQPSQQTQTPSQPQDDGCGPHGWLHGSHCHCDSGYLEHPDQLICIATDEYVLLTTQPVQQRTNTDTQPQSQQTQTPSQPQDDGCGPHGWLHGSHCHCDSGYLEHPDQLICISTDEYILLSDAIIIDEPVADEPVAQETPVEERSPVPQEPQSDSCAPNGVFHIDHCDCNAGYVPDGLSCVSLESFLESAREQVDQSVVEPPPVAEASRTQSQSTPPSDSCGPHGVFHIDHCDCNAGYVGQGLSCVSIASLLADRAPVQAPARRSIPQVQVSIPDLAASAAKVEDDADGCGIGGVFHIDHCDCDAGFLPIDLMCVPIESLYETYTTKAGEAFTEGSLIFDQYLASYPEDIDSVLLNWKVPEGPYDGFLVQASMNDVPVYAEVLPKYRNAYRYIPKQSGLHTVAIVPYVYLEDGSPLLYADAASTLVYLQAEAPSSLEPEMLHDPNQRGFFVRFSEFIERLVQ